MRSLPLFTLLIGITITAGCGVPVQQAQQSGEELATSLAPPAAVNPTTSNPALNSVMNEIADQNVRQELSVAWSSWEKLPSDSASANAVIRIVEQAGEQHFTNSQREKAVPAFKLAVELHGKALSAGVDVADEIEAYIYYNDACIKCLDQKLPEALDLLGKAVETGFADLDSILHDPDLDAVRKMPEFKTQLEGWQVKIHANANQ